MKNRILFLILFLASFFTEIKATHIVGGNFDMVYSGRGYIYYVYMDMYYDDINAAAGLLDADLTINILVFSKATNNSIREFQLVRPTANNSDFVSYKGNSNGCANPNILRTRLFKYSGQVNLEGLDEPQGYYISWERCCRNYQTLNIVHQDINGDYISGQVFYLEFPPVDKLGNRFINSSPIFNTIPAEYLCKNNFVNINFSAKDPDGDSLVYSMANPKQGHTTDLNAILNVPGPAPYTLITWQPGYSTNNAIHGNPSLSINSSTGILTVNPSETGLFAFSVICEEYRNGVRLGEVQRDYQYLILDCPVTHKPSVGLNKSNNGNKSPGVGGTNWGNATSDTLIVKLNRDTCYTIFLTDSTASYYNTSIGDSLLFGKTNLPTSVLSYSPPFAVLTPGSDTLSMLMCFSPCDKVLITKDSLYYLDIVAVNDKCPVKSDTLRTYVYVDVEDNNVVPKITTSLDPDRFILTHPDSLVHFKVYGTDADPNDIKEITAIGYRFRLSTYGMLFTKIHEDPDSLAYLFTWKPTCEDLKNQVEYTINFYLKDESCIYTHKDTTSVTIRLEDVDTGLEHLAPPNLITPNGDSLNDCFHLPNLPADNCTYAFKSVEIYNRWGAKVFSSSDRNFKWCASEVSDGIYYYGINLTEKYVKGWLQILR